MPAALVLAGCIASWRGRGRGDDELKRSFLDSGGSVHMVDDEDLLLQDPEKLHGKRFNEALARNYERSLRSPGVIAQS